MTTVQMVALALIAVFLVVVLLVAFLAKERSDRVSRFVHGSMRLLPITAICNAIIAMIRKDNDSK